MGEDDVGQIQKLLQPRPLRAAVECHIFEAFGTRDHSTHRNDVDVEQLMFDLTRTARVFQSKKRWRRASIYAFSETLWPSDVALLHRIQSQVLALRECTSASEILLRRSTSSKRQPIDK